ncbi:hypothetical protein PPL_02897 [Heterostelium album PN500]|uniref:FNIP repeat-containing protein n=1 Tax=Heterostelium pallidum (strain ATCC 26659 / Pp 5 / PN500) TaxID=670386 RepID=D3B3D1_HETP5|nr:hypothetical protein PPL_02897 [Heterostelium album PN500]EFA83829.1 hypothetical protein PPL_02897 [Heterostelium album PN500]|eukprot:XP_020435946.1 hypothetical protein PPL_02897 [Heterostelium album PN500]
MLDQIPLYLIKCYILSNKDISWFDRISVSLLCKTLFVNRSQYLEYDPKDIKVKDVSKLSMKSYSSMFEYALSLHNNRSMKYSDFLDVVQDNEESNDPFILKNSTYDYKVLTTKTDMLSQLTANSNIKLLNVDSIGFPMSLASTSLVCIEFGKVEGLYLRSGLFPETLEELHLPHAYNSEIRVGVFPRSLKKLVFGFDFNQPLEAGIFPEGLQTIEFGFLFDQPIGDGLLPNSLENLTFGGSFSWEFDRQSQFPSNLKALCFQAPDIARLEYLPATLLKLKMNIIARSDAENRIFLPNLLGQTPCLEELIYWPANFTFMIPSTVKSLQLICSADNTIENIPASVRSLVLLNKITSQLAHVIPPTVTSLSFAREFTNSGLLESSFLQSGLRVLHLGKHHEPIKFESNTLPDTLEELYIYAGVVEKFQKNCLPHSLRILSINNTKYRHAFEEDVLPPNLEELHLLVKEDISLDLAALPSSLKLLELSDSYSKEIVDSTSNNNNEQLQQINSNNNRLTLEVGISFFAFNNKIETLPKSIDKVIINTDYANQYTIKRFDGNTFLAMDFCDGGFVTSTTKLQQMLI